MSHAGQRGARRGMNVMVVVLLAAIMAAAGVFYLILAQQSGRSAHWFVLSQLAFDVAGTGAREAQARLAELNSRPAALGAGGGGTAYLQLFEAMAAGTAAKVTLASSASPATLTTACASQLDALKDYSPVLEVTAELLPGAPLVDPALGLPELPGEQRGVLRLTARGAVRHALGQRVDRVVTVEKSFKIVSGLPDLLGRFVLFASGRAPGSEPNVIAGEVSELSFDAAVKPADPHPLIVQAGARYQLIREEPDPDVPTETIMVRDQSALTTAPADLLDRQGWIYLGGGGAPRWPLHVAHGYSRFGESFLFDGYRVKAPYGDAGFQGRFTLGWNAAFGCGVSFPPPASGLYQFQHGYATNFEVLGLVDGAGAVQDDLGAPTKMVSGFGPRRSSALRLFGEPQRASPTLVFGPVLAESVQRAAILHERAAACTVEGSVAGGFLQLYGWPDVVAEGGGIQNVLSTAFGAEYDLHATGPVSEPFAARLARVIHPAIKGKYSPDIAGMLEGPPGTGEVDAASQLLPWLSFKSAAGPTAAQLQKLWDGDPGSPAVFTQNLSAGPNAFFKATWSKLTYIVQTEGGALPAAMLSGGVLTVPGVVQVPDALFEIGPIDRIARGGIVVVNGNIRIRGPILRGLDPDAVPLTLVALTGDIIVESGPRVEAYLAALQGKVQLPPPTVPLTIRGGLMCASLPLDRLPTGTTDWVIEYGPEFDPAQLRAGMAAAYPFLRAYYDDPGGPKVAVSGGD